jgi:hypothetical protein
VKLNNVKKNSILVLTLAALPCVAFAGDISGTWKADFDTQIGVQKYVYTLKQDGTNLTGKISADVSGEKHDSDLKEGKVVGDAVSFVETLSFQGNDIRIDYKGTVSTNEIKLKRQVGEFASEEAVAKREAAATATSTNAAVATPAAPTNAPAK